MRRLKLREVARRILGEMEFGSEEEFKKYDSQHDMRDDTEVYIAGKKTTAGQARKNGSNADDNGSNNNTDDSGEKSPPGESSGAKHVSRLSDLLRSDNTEEFDNEIEKMNDEQLSKFTKTLQAANDKVFDARKKVEQGVEKAKDNMSIVKQFLSGDLANEGDEYKVDPKVTKVFQKTVMAELGKHLGIKDPDEIKANAK